MTATTSFVSNVAGDLPDLQAPPQPCSIKNKTDSDNTGLDNNDNNNNNHNNNNKNKKLFAGLYLFFAGLFDFFMI